MIPPKREMIACILSEAHDRDISFFAGFGTSFLWCGSLAHAPVQEAHPIKRSFDTHCLYLRIILTPRRQEAAGYIPPNWIPSCRHTSYHEDWVYSLVHSRQDHKLTFIT